MRDIDECYKLLAMAIIQRAAEDYLLYGESTYYQGQRARIENFFRSERFRHWTNGAIDPEYLIEGLRKKRRWNEVMRIRIAMRYGSMTKFAQTVRKDGTADYVRHWLKSTQYPPEMRIWEKLLCE